MPRFDIVQARSAFDALSDFSRLNQLDELWTAYLREPGPVPSEQFNQLDRLVAQMRELLDYSERHADFLLDLIRRSPQDFDRAFGIVLKGTRLEPAQEYFWGRLTQGFQRFSHLASDQLELLRSHSAAERNLLSDKIAAIRANGIVEGDLSQNYKCALEIAILAASIAALISTGAILAPAVVAAAHLGPAAVLTAVANLEGMHIFLGTAHSMLGIAALKEKCPRFFDAGK